MFEWLEKAVREEQKWLWADPQRCRHGNGGTDIGDRWRVSYFKADHFATLIETALILPPLHTIG